jgi:hypothetical protein
MGDIMYEKDDELKSGKDMTLIYGAHHTVVREKVRSDRIVLFSLCNKGLEI